MRVSVTFQSFIIHHSISLSLRLALKWKQTNEIWTFLVWELLLAHMCDQLQFQSKAKKETLWGQNRAALPSTSISSPFLSLFSIRCCCCSCFFGSKNINFTRIQCDVIVARWIVLNILKLSVCWKSLLISFRDLIKFPYKFIALIPSRSVK